MRDEARELTVSHPPPHGPNLPQMRLLYKERLERQVCETAIAVAIPMMSRSCDQKLRIEIGLLKGGGVAGWSVVGMVAYVEPGIDLCQV